MNPIRRGAVLLEVMLALVLFAAAGSAVLGIVRQAVGTVERSRLRLDGLDLARSAMSMIESGLANAETLSGPVSSGPLAWGAETGGLEEAPANGAEWVLEIQTEQSDHPGLTMVSIRAAFESPTDDDNFPSVTLRQLVRIAGGAEGSIGEEDDLFSEFAAPEASSGGAR